MDKAAWFASEPENKGLSFMTIYVLGVAWLYFGTWTLIGISRFWGGAIACGPRYLIPTLPLVVIMLRELLKYPRKPKYPIFQYKITKILGGGTLRTDLHFYSEFAQDKMETSNRCTQS
jgi:hypothetical protein